jgi:glyoxalase family protein
MNLEIMSPSLNGLHHVTAVTATATANLEFYTHILGMRLVKKTVNQDDVSAYHLFYADALGSPGTDLTFFDWAGIPRVRNGAGVVTETALRVAGGAEALGLWTEWFDKNNVSHGRIEEGVFPSLAFQDPEGQQLRLIAAPGAEAHPWRGSPLPPEASVFGLGGVTLTVRDFEPTAQFLTEVLGFRVNESDPELFEVGQGGPGAQLRLLTSATPSRQGAGGVHHVAWSVSDVAGQRAWEARLAEFGIGASGIVDRFYFQSLYFRIPGGILFEIATEGPGFTADGEDLDHLGERLSLPPFLEGRRAEIERGLKPLG